MLGVQTVLYQFLKPLKLQADRMSAKTTTRVWGLLWVLTVVFVPLLLREQDMMAMKYLINIEDPWVHSKGNCDRCVKGFTVRPG